MKFLYKLIVFTFFLLVSKPILANNTDSVIIRKMANQILTNSKCYEDLRILCKNIGGRIAGSPQAAKAVDWATNTLNSYNISNYKQPCIVPHWNRGTKEIGQIFVSNNIIIPVHVCALGNSEGTGSNGLKAPVIEITSWTQLDSLSKNGIKGKIVFYNRPMNPTFIDAGHAYGNAVDQRFSGAAKAAKYGAVGVLVRSVTHTLDNFPHTGAMKYDEKYAKIPAMAIATTDANILHEKLIQNNDVNFYMENTSTMLQEELSYNVIGEIKGTEFPNEIIVVSGHLDAWDNGEGAHDDGTGVVQAFEVLRTFQLLGIAPKRTIRCVAYMNEENGTRGGKAYADSSKAKHEINIAALESDGGGFTPTGWAITGDSSAFKKLNSWQNLFSPYNLNFITTGGGGSDIGPLKDLGAALINMEIDNQHYFDYHHTANDVFEHVIKRELELGVVAEAAMVYLISEYGLK